MLRISKLADYATVVMSYMAHRPADTYSAARISEQLDIGQPTVSKILKLLAHGGLLSAQRGVNGGYLLAQAPDGITVAQIIDAIEGNPVGLTECSSLPGVCEQESGCAIRGNWQRISQVVRRALEGVTLADMALPKPVPVQLFSREQLKKLPARPRTGERA